MIDLIGINKYYKNAEETLHVLKDVNCTSHKGKWLRLWVHLVRENPP